MDSGLLAFARDRIGRTTGGLRHDHANRMVRIFGCGRVCERTGNEEQKQLSAAHRARLGRTDIVRCVNFWPTSSNAPRAFAAIPMKSSSPPAHCRPSIL